MGEDETEIDFVLTNKEHWLFTQNVIAISAEFQHELVVADMDKVKIRYVVRRHALRDER